MSQAPRYTCNCGNRYPMTATYQKRYCDNCGTVMEFNPTLPKQKAGDKVMTSDEVCGICGSDTHQEGCPMILELKVAEVSKSVMAISHEVRDAYQIELGTDLHGGGMVLLLDLIPVHFELIRESVRTVPKAGMIGVAEVDEGRELSFLFNYLEPDQQISVSYRLVETSNQANPRSLQMVYRR